MAKTEQNMLDYIGDKMDALDFDGDLDLNWDKEAHVLEVELTMYVDAAAGYEVEDQDGQTVDEGGEVDYADAILFFDSTRLNGADYADNYLTVIGFAGKKGIEQAKVDALFGYLQTLLDDGQSDLFDFVDGTSDAETFALHFDQAKFDAAYAEQPAATKATFLPYPKY
ncbi:DUF3013 family protein [Lacticaseibacillus parakribbianus]|uniref:DUF3013 family protein n=1 Tax=Lacticaseibacillus parakribbianus TaxID=2970927 RepID=UPI0021CB2626|nr:DUF3013 family protein [Lacticaseibacillus parakribbianus]